MADRRKRYVWNQVRCGGDGSALFWECKVLDPIRMRIFRSGKERKGSAFDVPSMPSANGTAKRSSKWTLYVYAVQDVDGREVHHPMAYCTEYEGREEAEQSAKTLGKKYSKRWPAILAAWKEGFFTELTHVFLTTHRRNGMQLVVVDEEGEPFLNKDFFARFEPEWTPAPLRKQSEADKRSRNMTREEAEQEAREALEACDGDVTEAARLLGIKFPSSLYKKLRDLGIDYAVYRPDDWEERKKAARTTNGNYGSSEEVEQVTREALEACDGDAMEAANLLGVNFSIVYQRIKQYGIDQEEYKT